MKERQQKRRCRGADGSDALRLYHDREWGVPVHSDHRHFEFLVLESAQAGLSWATVLGKREHYRTAFADFDPHRVARFDRHRIEALLQDPGLIRNRRKIEAAVHNARMFLSTAAEFGSFDHYIWGFVGGRSICNRRRSAAAIPARSRVSDALSKDMKKRGFRFVGSIVLYSHLQATGLVNDHELRCFRHAECAGLAERAAWRN